MDMKQFWNVVRWIVWAPAIVVGAFVGARIVRVIGTGSLRFGVEQWENPSVFVVFGMLYEGFGMAAAWIAMAWWVAPAGKAIAARAAAGGLVALCGFMGYFAALDGRWDVVGTLAWALLPAAQITARGLPRPAGQPGQGSAGRPGLRK
jgi:hypothetical protein